LPQITSSFQAFPHPVPSLLRYFVPAQPLSTPSPSYTPPSFTRILHKSLPLAVVYSVVVYPVRPPLVSALVPPSCHRLPPCLLRLSYSVLRRAPSSTTSSGIIYLSDITDPTAVIASIPVLLCDDSRTNTQIERTYSDTRRDDESKRERMKKLNCLSIQREGKLWTYI
jgi:hypothetical protein